MLSARNIGNGELLWSEAYRQISETDFADEDRRTQIRTNDVLLTIVGSLGRSAVVPKQCRRFCLQRSVAVLRPKESIDPQFLSYWLRSPHMQALFETEAKGTAQKGIYLRQLSSFPLRIPPIDLQRRIVAKLDELLARSREVREQLEAVPALVEQYRQSVLAAAFSGELTADWRKKNPNVEPASKLLERIRAERRSAWEAAELAKMKAKGKLPKDDKWKSQYAEPTPVDTTEFPVLPATWSWASIEDLCPFDGPAVYGIIQPGEHVEGGVPYIRPLDIFGDGTVVLADLKRTSRKIADDYERSELRAGDVVLSIVGTIGKVLVVNAELSGANITQSSIRIRPPRGVPTSFTKLVLQSPLLRREYDKYRFGNAVQRLNVEHVRKLVVPVAPSAEAEAISQLAQQRLNGAERVAAGIEAEHLDRLERALLAKAFRGELVT